MPSPNTRSERSSMIFFSSIRRHTRYWRDWSSDVCSSDLQSPPADGVAAGAGGRTGRFASLGQGLQQMLAFGTLIALVIIFFIASPRFLTISNLSSILLSTAVIGILAVGTTFVIITGGIDLSLGT